MNRYNNTNYSFLEKIKNLLKGDRRAAYYQPMSPITVPLESIIPELPSYEEAIRENNIQNLNIHSQNKSKIKCFQDFSGAIQCSRCEDGIVSLTIKSNDGFRECMCLNCKAKDPLLKNIRIIPILPL